MSDDIEEHRQRALKTVHPDVLTEETLEKFAENYPERSRLQAYMEAVTDVRYRLPATMLAEVQSRYNDVYMYFWKWCAKEYVTRAPHCVELPFVMDKLGANLYLFVEHGRVQGYNPPKELQRAAQSAWVNFAKYDTPNGPGVPEKWPEYNTETRATMVIDEEWHVEYDLRKKDRELFMPLYPEMRRFNKMRRTGMKVINGDPKTFESSKCHVKIDWYDRIFNDQLEVYEEWGDTNNHSNEAKGWKEYLERIRVSEEADLTLHWWTYKGKNAGENPPLIICLDEYYSRSWQYIADREGLIIVAFEYHRNYRLPNNEEGMGALGFGSKPDES